MLKYKAICEIWINWILFVNVVNRYAFVLHRIAERTSVYFNVQIYRCSSETEHIFERDDGYTYM